MTTRTYPNVLRSCPSVLGLVLSAASLPLAAQNVHTVDDSGGADFLTIEQAIFAASDGDLILVHEGAYVGCRISGKSLTVVAADGPGTVEVQNFFLFNPTGTIAVDSLAADQQVILRGLRTNTAPFTENEVAAYVVNCEGPVLFEDCELRNTSGVALDVFNASVTVQRSVIDAGGSQYDAFINEYLSRPGIEADDATVFLHDCDVRGSVGPDAQQQPFGPVSPPGPGGSAIFARFGSRVFVFGSTLTGGDGGSGTATFCFDGKSGGNGITTQATSLVRLRDTTVEAGVAGVGGPGCGLGDGLDGVPLFGNPDTFEMLPGLSYPFSISSPVREGETVLVTYSGEPGDVAFMAISESLRPGFYLPARSSALHLGPFTSVVMLDPVPPSGTRTLSIPIPELGPGIDFLAFHCQIALVQGGGLNLSGPTSVTYLDQSFCSDGPLRPAATPGEEDREPERTLRNRSPTIHTPTVEST